MGHDCRTELHLNEMATISDLPTISSSFSLSYSHVHSATISLYEKLLEPIPITNEERVILSHMGGYAPGKSQNQITQHNLSLASYPRNLLRIKLFQNGERKYYALNNRIWAGIDRSSSEKRTHQTERVIQKKKRISHRSSLLFMKRFIFGLIPNSLSFLATFGIGILYRG